jgi:hypothetical protein
MKRTLSMLAAVALLGLAACEGPEGPAGPPGPQGPEGPAGEPGLDATAGCTECHVGDTELFAREVQYWNSVHFTGGNFERASIDAEEPDEPNDCAPCHSHEGFIETQSTGAMEAELGFENPSPVNCRTCHMIHTNYDESDYMLRTTAPVELWTGEGTVDVGTGNLCANCHQGRPVEPWPEIDGPDVTLTSSRYGYHHGPQAQVLTASGGFAFDGSLTIPNEASSHGTPSINPDGCVTCHMAAAFGNQAGGHTWAMEYLYHGGTEDLVTGCIGCHPSIESFEFHDVQAKVEADLEILADQLKAIGIMSSSGSAVTSTPWAGSVAAAFLNYKMVEEDRSLGVHQPQFVQALLKNTIEEMENYVP